MNQSGVVAAGLDHVVPSIAMASGRVSVDLSPLISRALLARGGGRGVPRGLHAPPRCCRRRGHAMGHRRMAHARTATPVFGTMATPAMVERVPCAGPGGHMTDADVPPRRVAQPVQRHRPQPGPTAVAAPTRSGQQDLPGLGVHLLPPPRPPRLHGRHGPRRRLLIDAHADPAPVWRQRVHAVGERLAPRVCPARQAPAPARAGRGGAMHAHRWHSLPPPLCSWDRPSRPAGRAAAPP